MQLHILWYLQINARALEFLSLLLNLFRKRTSPTREKSILNSLMEYKSWSLLPILLWFLLVSKVLDVYRILDVLENSVKQ